jgi:cytochrome c oxidase subunit 2
MDTPLESPAGEWWDRSVNRRETLWLGISGAWAAVLFGWMAGWTRLGEQNPIGETTRVAPTAYQEQVASYKEAADETQVAGDDVLVPAGTDVYVGALRYAWDGLPVRLDAGTEYDVHIGAYDVQHGFSVRAEDTLSKQISLQVLPGYEWTVPMQFDEPGTYHVVCNEFCGTGHRTMHGAFYVR